MRLLRKEKCKHHVIHILGKTNHHQCPALLNYAAKTATFPSATTTRTTKIMMGQKCNIERDGLVCDTCISLKM